MNTGKVILGTVAGLALGVIAGILFAPEKGSTTRRQIMDKGNGFVEDLKSKFDEFRDTITEKFESTKDDAENFANIGKTMYEDAKRDVKNAAANLKHEVAADRNNVMM